MLFVCVVYEYVELVELFDCVGYCVVCLLVIVDVVGDCFVVLVGLFDQLLGMCGVVGFFQVDDCDVCVFFCEIDCYGVVDFVVVVCYECDFVGKFVVVYVVGCFVVWFWMYVVFGVWLMCLFLWWWCLCSGYGVFF